MHEIEKIDHLFYFNGFFISFNSNSTISTASHGKFQKVILVIIAIIELHLA